MLIDMTRNHYLETEIILFVEPPLIEVGGGSNPGLGSLYMEGPSRHSIIEEVEESYRGCIVSVYNNLPADLLIASTLAGGYSNVWLNRQMSSLLIANGGCHDPYPHGYGLSYTSVFVIHSEKEIGDYRVIEPSGTLGPAAPEFSNQWVGELDIVPQGYVVGHGFNDVFSDGSTSGELNAMPLVSITSYGDYTEEITEVKGPNRLCNGVRSFANNDKMYLPYGNAMQLVYRLTRTYEGCANEYYNWLKFDQLRERLRAYMIRSRTS